MKSLRPLFIWAAAALLLGSTAVFGHQPFESTTVARLQHNRLETKLTMSAQMARQLATALVVGGENSSSLETLLPGLKEKAGALFEITAGEMTLAPTLADAQLDKLGEVEIILIYPEPAHGRVRMVASYLQQLPVGYAGTLDVYDADEKPVASSHVLARGQNRLEWLWPPVMPTENGRTVMPAAGRELNGFSPGVSEVLMLGVALVLLLRLYASRQRRAEAAGRAALAPNNPAGGGAP